MFSNCICNCIIKIFIQVVEMKKKPDGRSPLSAQKQISSHKKRSGEPRISTQDEIQRLKAQKVIFFLRIMPL